MNIWIRLENLPEFLMAVNPFQVRLNNYEGPLDLLLYFIRRDEMDIYDIPIAKITEEYLTTLDQARSSNVGIAGEFVVMAATLMRVKAKMLLPRPELDDEGELIDPRTELMLQLQEYTRFKDAASNLDILANEENQLFKRTTRELLDEAEAIPGLYLKTVSLFDLATHFKTAIENRPVMNPVELHREIASFDDQKNNILASLDGEGKLRFSTLINKFKSKIEMIVAFLALLDLIRLKEVVVYQNELFEDLEIHKVIIT
jgi:segregation and condensation protein A